MKWQLLFFSVPSDLLVLVVVPLFLSLSALQSTLARSRYIQILGCVMCLRVDQSSWDTRIGNEVAPKISSTRNSHFFSSSLLIFPIAKASICIFGCVCGEFLCFFFVLPFLIHNNSFLGFLDGAHYILLFGCLGEPHSRGSFTGHRPTELIVSYEVNSYYMFDIWNSLLLLILESFHVVLSCSLSLSLSLTTELNVSCLAKLLRPLSLTSHVVERFLLKFLVLQHFTHSTR